ncbi:MAG: response regulator [Archangium sp.]|nr:response regulator [Archangium sp.]
MQRLNNLPVLVVDDDHASAKLLAVILRGAGCEVHIASSAEEALSLVPIVKPKLLVLDLVLPLMSGMLLAQQLKQAPATKDVVIIAVSAFNGSQVEHEAKRAGCIAYLRKPIDPLSFTQLVATHLGDQP